MEAAVRLPMDERYMKAYMDGYTAALEKVQGESAKPYLTVEDVVERYHGISKSKAYGIMNAVRHCCNGGKLNNDRMILRSELEWWEQQVEVNFVERL